MKKLLIVLMILTVQCAFARGVPSPATPRIMINADGDLISTTNPLPVDAEVNIGSITVDAFPVYADEAGNVATATVDADNRVITRDAVPTEWQQQTLTLVADTAQSVTTEITGERKFILIRAQEEGKEFWVSVDGAAVIGACMLARDWIRVDAPEDIAISIIASEAFDLSVMEAGY